MKGAPTSALPWPARPASGTGRASPAPCPTTPGGCGASAPSDLRPGNTGTWPAPLHLERRERLVPFRQVHPVIELRMDDEHRRLPVLHEVERRPLLVQREVGVGRTAELPVHEPQLLGRAGHA